MGIHLEKSRKMRRRYLGEDHPDTALTLFNLALTKKAQSKYEESANLLTEAIQILNFRLGETNKYTQIVNEALNNLKNENHEIKFIP